MTSNHTSNDSPVTKKPRRINGLLIFGLLALVIIVFKYSPHVSAIYCDETTLNPAPDVIMLSAWWCPYCAQARKYLTSNNISYCEYDMERSATGEKMYRERNGRGIPMLLIGDHQINGFDEHRIEQALEILHSP